MLQGVECDRWAAESTGAICIADEVGDFCSFVVRVVCVGQGLLVFGSCSSVDFGI